MLQGQVGVGQGLSLHALGGVHHQHRALTGGQRPGHLVVEVHVARSVNQIEVVGLPILGLVLQTDGPGLDGDATLPLQVHVVQQLGLHLPGGHRVALLNKAVGQGRFAMVNVGNDRKIADLGLVSQHTHLHKANLRGAPQSGARR